MSQVVCGRSRASAKIGWRPRVRLPACRRVLASRSASKTLYLRGVLFLAGSYVSGSVKDLREIEGLGSEWGPAAEADSFTPCTSYAASCQASGLSLVPGAKDLAGRDECGCCVGSTMVRDERTGMCDRAKFTVTITSSSSAEPGKVGSYGAKDFEREAKLHEHP